VCLANLGVSLAETNIYHEQTAKNSCLDSKAKSETLSGSFSLYL